MQGNSVFLILATALALSGCASTNPEATSTTADTNMQDSMSPPAATEIPPESSIDPAPTTKPRRRARATDTTIPGTPGTPEAAASQTTEQLSNAVSKWQPNEGHILRGNELMIGLQREIGRQPTVTEMQNRLRTHMGLSAAQAQKLIATLGGR